MLNRVQLIRNLGHDPEIRRMQEGNEVATFSLATHSSWQDEHGEWNTKTEWHSVVVYREALIARIKETLKKGGAVFVEGKLAYVDLQDKHTQQKRRMAHIVISEKGGQVEFLHSGKSEERDVSSIMSEDVSEDVLQACSQVGDVGTPPIDSIDSENSESETSYSKQEKKSHDY